MEFKKRLKLTEAAMGKFDGFINEAESILKDIAETARKEIAALTTEMITDFEKQFNIKENERQIEFTKVENALKLSLEKIKNEINDYDAMKKSLELELANTKNKTLIELADKQAELERLMKDKEAEIGRVLATESAKLEAQYTIKEAELEKTKVDFEKDMINEVVELKTECALLKGKIESAKDIQSASASVKDILKVLETFISKMEANKVVISHSNGTVKEV